MKNILKKVSIILLGGMLVMNVGCARKGSREWIEKQISDIERVYPTEDAEDLFEKFPNGFRISQTRLFQENGKKYSITLEMKGDKNTKKITEKVKKSTSKTEPYKEIVEKESEVKYKKGENLVLAKPELTEELLTKNYFLFQKLKLDKNVFKKLEATEGTFSYDTYRYDVVYKITNNEINNYLGFSNEEVSMEVFGQYSENDKTYFHTLAINDKDKKLHFFEKVVEDKGNTEDDAE
ncbi:hypothetical protein [Gemella sanguinis]|mgnify:FL=1|jgi:hypothetical protein|uniref:hypothetical protein n=1 Tax=Gemella sanguinis TaxID=84135 RepID=UPI0028EBCA0B|nr:hypothetical protein [Gemella sanguinis]